MEELRIDSVVRGHHVYKSVWTPVIGEELYLEPEESNEHDKYAVAVRKDGEIVRHVPRSFSTFCTKRWRRGETLPWQTNQPGFVYSSIPLQAS